LLILLYVSSIDNNYAQFFDQYDIKDRKIVNPVKVAGKDQAINRNA